MKFAAPMILGLAIAALAGCASTPTTPDVPRNYGDQAVVASAGQAGSRAIAVTLVSPLEAVFQSQAVVHRWVDADIFQYEVTLKVKTGTTFSDLATPLTVVVPRKGTPKTKAVFTNLKQGSIYQVAVTAKGNVGGTAASTVLNSTPATATFDFSATQDVQDTLSADLQIAFDAVDFNGSGSANLQTPAEGTYRNPSAPEAGTAQ